MLQSIALSMHSSPEDVVKRQDISSLGLCATAGSQLLHLHSVRGLEKPVEMPQRLLCMHSALKACKMATQATPRPAPWRGVVCWCCEPWR